ncbi:potassium transporter Kup [Denitratisoma oestradiolicum]|uniref:Probable potassium transport system protein Kup n=1 Tax=Denitratisoma oestradiolicum TaxID=311182 RepID=A0A6S6XYN6_9PROT|nr:potassium transporter Kup [Denitratisoma oestradiolicum]TWO79370.1 potassium transporter Kup [Denitratisoma oestradiolicum]CAB1367982.1 potassium transporter [Denitratisoma oestradiolicum]
MSASKARDGTLALAALGVVYGDIGTSPLYTMKEIFAGAHHPVPITPDNVLGILSLIVWSLILVVTVKYVYFIMKADNKGEGGIMALMALALRPMAEGGRRQALVLVLGLFGAALFYGDGVITPAISVLSAVEGLEVATPAFKPYVLPIALAVLTSLFLIQRKGTGSVGALFGPITALWFLVLALLGGVNIAAHPGVLLAFDPRHSLDFFLAQPSLAFLALGAVVLAVTGTEALYADMGHFGRRPVRLAWLGLALPALVLNYFGQGALLLGDASAIENPFYRLAPTWALYPMVALATMATVIASQAVISGAFSITQQAIQLGYCPRLEILHTSPHEIGQIYLPAVNWVLLFSVVALVLGFGSSTKLAAAYGIAVTGTMVITSLLAFVVARWLWGWPLWRAALGAAPFLLIDLAFFSANAVKIADGGWFPLAFGALVFMLLMTWKQGRRLLQQRLAADAMDLLPFIDGLELNPGELARVPGTAVFLTPNPDGVPHAMLHSLKHYKTLHERVVMTTVKVLDIPRVTDSQRVVVERLSGGFWRVRVFFGFMDEPDLPLALEWCAEQGLQLDMMDTSFFLGRETLIPKLRSEMPFWREKIFIALFRNAGSAAAYFRLPPNRVVELGAQVVL